MLSKPRGALQIIDLDIPLLSATNMKTISLSLAVSFFALNSFAQEWTPEFCRTKCLQPNSGWCFDMGLGAEKIARPFIEILRAARGESSGFDVDSCSHTLTVNGKTLRSKGNSCELKVGGQAMLLKTQIPSETTGVITNNSGALEIMFNNGKPNFTLIGGDNVIQSGVVPYLTAYRADDGKEKVLWSNGHY